MNCRRKQIVEESYNLQEEADAEAVLVMDSDEL
jgi:hypothetical protein